MQSNLFECHVVLAGLAGGFVETFGAVDLAVGAFADLFEADVVGDGAGGEGPAVGGVVGGGEGVGRGGERHGLCVVWLGVVGEGTG